MPNTPWLREFPSLNEIDQFNPDPVVYLLHRTLDDFASGIIPDNTRGFTFHDLKQLVLSLIKRQNEPGEFIIWGGNWSLISVDEGAPSDVRVDLIFFPSYIAVSFMTLFWYRYREQAESMPAFLDTLHKGLYFISSRRLFGHGIEGDDQRIEAVRILVKGRVHHYLYENISYCKQAIPLYEALIQFKNEHLYGGSFESQDLIDELIDIGIPSINFTESQFFSWNHVTDNTRLILEAPYNLAPDKEVGTEEIVTDIVARIGCASIIGKCSRRNNRYTGTLDDSNRNIFEEYTTILQSILKTHQIKAQYYGKNNARILHLIIRGMKNDYGTDVELSSRNGSSCSLNLVEQMKSTLAIQLERYSRRAYIVTSDRLFGGGSLYLDNLGNNHATIQNENGQTIQYNAVELRISRQLRDIALARIKDAIIRISESFEEMAS